MLLLVILLPCALFAQKPLKQMTFKNKKETVHVIRFNETVSVKFLNNYARKNGYKIADTSILDFLKQKKLPIHCQVFVFKIVNKDSVSWFLETNGSPYGNRRWVGNWRSEPILEYQFFNSHHEEEGDVEHYFCFKK